MVVVALGLALAYSPPHHCSSFPRPATAIRTGHTILPAHTSSMSPAALVMSREHPRAHVVASESVVVSEDYKLAFSLIAIGALILFFPVLPGGFFALLGTFLVVQTLRIRFVFDEEALEVKTRDLDQARVCTRMSKDKGDLRSELCKRMLASSP